MKYLKSIFIMMLGVALVFPMAAWTDHDKDQCPKDEATVAFGPDDDNEVSRKFRPLPDNSNHMLFPNEVAIETGGTVTFNILSGGHRVAIYPVSQNTVRQDIEEDLRQPNDPTTTADDTGCVNKLSGCNQNDQYLVTDGAGNLIIDTGLNPPLSIVDYQPGRVFSLAGFANGALTDGMSFTWTPSAPGRYLVICANRGHFTTDYMFGFVNVVACDDDDDDD